MVTASGRRRWSADPLADHAVLVAPATGEGELWAAEVLLPEPWWCVREFMLAARTPAHLLELASRVEIPVSGARTVAQQLISAGLMQEVDDGHGRAAPTVKVVVAAATVAAERSFIGAVCASPRRTVDQFFIAPRESMTIERFFGPSIYPVEGSTVFLAGTPRLWDYRPLWDDAARNSIGAVIIIDPMYRDAAEIALQACHQHELPYVVVVPLETGMSADSPSVQREIRRARQITPNTPVLVCETHDHDSVARVLSTLTGHARTTTDS
ncbi:hypothetical protein GCM10027294_22850 [Marinactinospora endophytica]